MNDNGNDNDTDNDDDDNDNNKVYSRGLQGVVLPS
jgi:hypothetical protein